MAAYSSLNTPTESNATEMSAQSESRRKLMRLIWIFQCGVSIPKIILSSLLLVFLFFLLFLQPPVGIIFVFILLFIDIAVAISIISIVVKQFWNARPDAWTAFKQELKKSLLATYLWIWSIWTLFTNPQAFFKTSFNNPSTEPLEEGQQHVVRKVMLWWAIYIVLVTLAFYPALWFAYKDWKAERDSAARSEIELENGDEHQIRLMSRTSIDSLDDLVEPDLDSHRLK